MKEDTILFFLLMMFTSLEQVYDNVYEPLKPVVDKIRSLFHAHKNVQEVLQRNAFVYKRGKNRAYINSYNKKDAIILGFGQGAAMVKEEPLLHYAFDEVKTVVAKVEIRSLEDIEKKSLAQLVDLAIHFRKSKK